MAGRMVALAQIMRRDPKTIPVTMTVRSAILKMHVTGIRHLIVVAADGVPWGLISQRDLLRFLADEGTPNTALLEVMTTPLITAGAEMAVQDAARLMHLKRIGCLPILSAANKLVGIVTRSDVLEYISA
jgi:CBS domain-containing protein